MTLLLLAQTIFGQLFAFRILRRTHARLVISSQMLANFGTAFALITAVGAIFLFHRAQMPLLLMFVALIVLKILLKVLERRQIELLAAKFPHFLDRWLLNLRMGMASTSAREHALGLSDPQFRALLAPLFEASTGTAIHQRHSFLKNHVVQELREAHAQPHNTVMRLQTLRGIVARDMAFRRKSGQALRQAVIQSVVLALLHLALLIFTVSRGSAAFNMDLILLSTLLTLCGILILRLMARRVRWTI